ncbi:hypothetical protein KJ953_00530 [Patescibacteria group bacterium]|nr:hypothetical protein [Patescibacteria group bacterium]
MDLSFFALGKFCENQAGNQFIKQPINLITSLIFFISALAIYRLLQKTKTNSKPVFIVLLTLTVVAGIGNLLMHLTPNPYFYLLDIGSLLIFFITGSIYYLYFQQVHLKEVGLLFFLLILSIVFKYVDSNFCHLFPLGTHFLLHISIPFAMYKLVTFLLLKL